MDLSIRRLNDMALTDELTRLNDTTERYGITLTKSDMLAVIESRDEALSDCGLVEFGSGAAARLGYALCDSPYVMKENYVETLCEMQSLFYRFRAMTDEKTTDERLVKYMVDRFNGPCEGSIELLSDMGPGKASI